MKNRLTTLIVATILLIASANVFGLPTVKINNCTPPYQVTVTGLDGSNSLGIYSVGQSFDTFCVEKHEYFYPGSTYYAEISEYAKRGGELTQDRLEDKSAYLYTKFMEDGFKDDPFFTNKLLQNAFHCIEERETSLSNYLVVEAENAVALGGTWYGKGLGKVRVLNLWKNPDGTDYAQDQLIMISHVPAPGAIILGGIGVYLVGWLRRRSII